MMIISMMLNAFKTGFLLETTGIVSMMTRATEIMIIERETTEKHLLVQATEPNQLSYM